jgi:riboflavin biosynthesis pyrimidine reductase
MSTSLSRCARRYVRLTQSLPISCSTRDAQSTRNRWLDPGRQYIAQTDGVEVASPQSLQQHAESIRRSALTDAKSQLARVQAQAGAIYGELSPAPTGVIHTVSAVRTRASASQHSPLGQLHVIKIEEAAPKSSSDFFVLNLWRVHCDAILTTGQILRAEPTLSYAQQGPLALGLTYYREQVLGKTGVTKCAILTRGSQLPAEHPVFRESSGLQLLVLTHPQHVAELQRLLEDRVEVVGLAQLDARGALDFLKRTGAHTIGVEAGPSVAGTLYAAPAVVEHLMLSICEAPIEARSVGGALPVDEELFAGLRLVSEVTRTEESGEWRFQHWQRAESSRRAGEG